MPRSMYQDVHKGNGADPVAHRMAGRAAVRVKPLFTLLDGGPSGGFVILPQVAPLYPVKDAMGEHEVTL